MQLFLGKPSAFNHKVELTQAIRVSKIVNSWVIDVKDSW